MADSSQAIRLQSIDQTSRYLFGTSDDQKLAGFNIQEPRFCECARIGKRELSWAPWVPGISNATPGSFLDRQNFEFAHQHIFFEASGENVGWGPKGIFSENSSEFEYHMDSTCYDGSLMREALAVTELAPPDFKPSFTSRIVSNFGFNKLYGFFMNNCQDFVARVRDNYDAILSRR